MGFRSVLDCPASVSREWSSVSGVASFWNPHQLAVFAATPDVSNVYLIAQCSSEVSEMSEVQRPHLLMAQIQRNMHAGNVQFRIELRAQVTIDTTHTPPRLLFNSTWCRIRQFWTNLVKW